MHEAHICVPRQSHIKRQTKKMELWTHLHGNGICIPVESEKKSKFAQNCTMPYFKWDKDICSAKRKLAVAAYKSNELHPVCSYDTNDDDETYAYTHTHTVTDLKSPLRHNYVIVSRGIGWIGFFSISFVYVYSVQCTVNVVYAFRRKTNFKREFIVL